MMTARDARAAVWLNARLPMTRADFEGKVTSLAALLASEYARGFEAAREQVRNAVGEALDAARTHTLASENSDLYVAYEGGAKAALEHVERALRPPEPPREGGA